jgi:uncharacterized damage-inducible protein DinB
MSQILAHVFRHHLWANSKLLDVCEELEDIALDATATGTYGSLRDTLVHMFAAEERYLRAMIDYSPGEPLHEGTYPGFGVLRERAVESGEALIDVAEREVGDRIITGEHPVRGKYAIPVSTFIAQAVNHATEHRSHVCTVLTQAGIEAPVLDVWTYEQEEGSRRQAPEVD